MRVDSTDKRAPSKQLNLNLTLRYQPLNSMTTYDIATTKKSPTLPQSSPGISLLQIIDSPTQFPYPIPHLFVFIPQGIDIDVGC